MDDTVAKKRRIHTMDELRGLCVILMVFFHAFYTLGVLFGVDSAAALLRFFSPLQPFFASLFILISGISSMFSRSNVKRGLKLAIVAAGVTAVTYFITPESAIWFGILHFLSISMIIFGIVKKLIEKVPPFAGIIACAILYMITFGIPRGALGIPGLLSVPLPEFLYRSGALIPFGFSPHGFNSSDYFPLFPNIFTFFLGGFLGAYAVNGRFPEALYKNRIKPLSFVGRHALIIYILHQPLIYGICWLIFTIF